MIRAKNPILAVKRSLDIIDFLQETGSAGVTEIADASELTKGTAHCHLATLQEYGYVVKEGNEYRLGLRFLDIAHCCRNHIDIYDSARAEVDKLADESGEIALLIVEENNEVVVLYKAESEKAVQTEGYAGYRNEIYHTAAGKVILAYMPDAERERIIRQLSFEAQTPNTITDEQELRESLEQIREEGVGYNCEESINGLVGVSAPIRDNDRNIYGAVSIMGPVGRIDEERLTTELPTLVRRTTNIIELNITSRQYFAEQGTRTT